MRQFVGILAVLGALVLSAPTLVLADNRADWGVAVSVGWEDRTLLFHNEAGFHLVVVDTNATIRGAGLGAMTLTDIRPGDRVDYAVSDWAGMAIADTLHVTPDRRVELR